MITYRTPATVQRDGHLLAASLDVEWTKNYRIPDGNVPFCWSITWLHLPKTPSPPPEEFAFTSFYVSGPGQTQELIHSADQAITTMLEKADLIIGHQVSSDLAILRNASERPLASVQALRERWHDRKNTPALAKRTVVDSRYDVGNVLAGTSRRLVDVCGELALDVTQPELARQSMTALHRDGWLGDQDPEARERITVLNLRHGLSAAYVAARATGRLHWTGTVNVNRILHDQLTGHGIDWPKSPTFQALL
ncbi:hypothetical protein [Actinomadura xylanilytica]|uniref:hypothetical protein n=1 Tax=Actinomadura xylanilytica TaxID=887459 RepID=UPI00255B20CE|nr:hypothetical protein [Actinomadura xylanilytica]MDL4770702.1 hypothetical protein [Actinomadura xylanilytica]